MRMASFSLYIFTTFGAFGINRKSDTSITRACSDLFSANLTVFARIVLFGILVAFRRIITGVTPFVIGIEALAGM